MGETLMKSHDALLLFLVSYARSLPNSSPRPSNPPDVAPLAAIGIAPGVASLAAIYQCPSRRRGPNHYSYQ